MIDETRLRALIRDEVRRVLQEERKPSGEFVSVASAAKIAAVSAQTIRKWITEGKLARHSAGRVFRVRRTDLEKLLSAPSPGAKPESPEVLAAKLYRSGGL